MAKVTSIWRHPIKSHGREALNAVALIKGQTMPWDRVWAVAHEKSTADGSAWAPCANFSRVSKAPGLMAITVTLDEASESLVLSHPDLEDLTIRPDTEGEKLVAWTKSLIPENRAASARVIRTQKTGFTDSDFPSVTLCNLASHRAVETQLGQDLSIHRWRGNIWFDGGEPWAEWDWIGRDVRIGEVIFRPRERTDRCQATTANPDTGVRDADTLGALSHWGHQDFSIRAEIIQSGTIKISDQIELL